MDGRRFDQLSRVLGDRATRRGVLGILGGLAGLRLSETVAKRRRHRRRRGGGRTYRITVQSQETKADCAARCAQVFPPGRARGQCISAAEVCFHPDAGEPVCCINPGSDPIGCCGPENNRICTVLVGPQNCGACGETCANVPSPTPTATVSCCGTHCGLGTAQPCDPDATGAPGGTATCCSGPSGCLPSTGSATGFACCSLNTCGGLTDVPCCTGTTCSASAPDVGSCQ
jgi:hypothetical protein